MKEKVFYRKIKKQKTVNALDFIDNSVKLNMNFNMVKNGANINEVFKNNPCGLDAFLSPKVKCANQPSKSTVAKVTSRPLRVRYHF